MNEFREDAKAFSLPFEAWYSESAVRPIREHPYIMIGFYYENDGTEGEFEIEFNNIGIELHAYQDSWEALSKMPELIKLMADIDRDCLNPDINEFAEVLKGLGYKDITERINPYKNN